jgi:uncharacterized protein GlcG (DUF336 family)
MLSITLLLVVIAATALADHKVPGHHCTRLPNYADFTAALEAAQAESNGGFQAHVWATVVDESGVNCIVTHTGKNAHAPTMLSRGSSASKAYTASTMSHSWLAYSSANLWSAVQPGQTLFGLAATQPQDMYTLGRGDVNKFGTTKDPILRTRTGGVISFAGGLPLFQAQEDGSSIKIGAIGVSGDSACVDHTIVRRCTFFKRS